MAAPNAAAPSDLTAKVLFQERMMVKVRQQIKDLERVNRTLTEQLDFALERIVELETYCLQFCSSGGGTVVAGTGSSEGGHAQAYAPEQGSQYHATTSDSELLHETATFAEAWVADESQPSEQVQHVDPESGMAVHSMQESSDSIFQSTLMKLTEKIGVTFDHEDIQVQKKQTWTTNKPLFVATLRVPSIGESFKGEGENEEEAKCAAVEKALHSLDEDSREIRRTVRLRQDVVPHIIGKGGKMKTLLESAFPSTITIKPDLEATIVGRSSNVHCILSLFELATKYFGETPGPIQLPAKLKRHLLPMRLPPEAQALLVSAEDQIGKEAPALIWIPKDHDHNGAFELWIISSTVEARLAAKLDVIQRVVHKLQRLDCKPNALADFAKDLEAKNSEMDDASIDVKHYFVQKDCQRPSFVSYAAGADGQLAERVAKTTMCRLVRYFEDPDADAPAGKVKVIACILGERRAREYAHMCIKWLLDTWKSGHYADIADKILERQDFSHHFVPIKKANQLKHDLKELQKRTETISFFQSVPESERSTRECMTLVIFSRDIDCRRVADERVVKFLKAPEGQRLVFDSPSTSIQPASMSASKGPGLHASQVEACSACSVSSCDPSIQNSLLSGASAPPGSTEARCFLSRTSFIKPQGGRITAADFKSEGGNIVLGPHGTEVRVLRSLRLQPAQERDIVHVTTECNMAYPFQITADHRLLVASAPGGDPRAMCAKDLVGERADYYLFDGSDKHQKVVKAEMRTQTEEIVEVTFENDAPVLAWVLPKHAHGKKPRPPLRDDAAASCLGARMQLGDHEPPVSNTFIEYHSEKPHTPLRSRSADAAFSSL